MINLSLSSHDLQHHAHRPAKCTVPSKQTVPSFPEMGPSHSSVILFHADTSSYVTAWWTKWEGAGPAKHYLNSFFNKVYSYPDELPHPVHCMTVTNSCVGKGEQIVQGPEQVVEEESGWDWFVWKQYLLMPEVLIMLQAVGSLTFYSQLNSSKVPPKSHLGQLPLPFEAYKTEASSRQLMNKVVLWEMDHKYSEYLTGYHLGGTRIRLLVCFFGLLLGTLLQDVLICSQFAPHWEERKRAAVSVWKATPDYTDSSQTAWKTPCFNSNYIHEKTDTPSQKHLCTAYLTVSFIVIMAALSHQHSAQLNVSHTRGIAFCVAEFHSAHFRANPLFICNTGKLCVA